MVPDASIAFAALILDSSSAAGRPPRRPRAAAAISPARVRSTMISRYMELSAPRMLNMNRPLGVVVSIASVIDLSAMPRRFKIISDFDEMSQRPCQPVKPPNHQHIALPCLVECLGQFRSICPAPSCRLHEHLVASRRRI
jgi:hypothetical protein